MGKKHKHAQNKNTRKHRQEPVTRPWDPYAGVPEEERTEHGARARAYSRLFDVEQRLYQMWEQRSGGQMDWAGEALGDIVDEEQNLWIAAVADKVAALGGHLDLIAVFPDQTVTLLREAGLHSPESDDTTQEDDGSTPPG